jgi:hypothetical protein
MNYEIAKLALLLAKLNSEGNVIHMLESIAWQMGISNAFEVVAQLYLKYTRSIQRPSTLELSRVLSDMAERLVSDIYIFI